MLERSIRERSARRFWICPIRAWSVDWRSLAAWYSAFSERSPCAIAALISFGRLTLSSVSIRRASSSSFSLASRRISNAGNDLLLLHREFLHVEPEAVLTDGIDLGLQDPGVHVLFLGQRQEQLLRLFRLGALGQLQVRLVRRDLLVDRHLEDPDLVRPGKLVRIDLFQPGTFGDHRR